MQGLRTKKYALVRLITRKPYYSRKFYGFPGFAANAAHRGMTETELA